jgi:hypothetical protein
MKEFTVIVEKGLAGKVVNIPSMLPLTRNFNEHDRIGYAEIFEEDGVIKARMSLTDEMAESILKMTPAVGGVHHPGDRVTVTSVSVSRGHNQDPSIGSIESQIR